MITIFIIDDHTIFREGIKLLIDTIPDVEVIGEASNGIEFLQLLEKHIPDVVLMDISMTKMDGIEATHRALEKYPELKILILSMFGDEVYLEKSIEAGVKGFIKKNADVEEMKRAIMSVSQGKSFYSGEIVELLSQMYHHRNDSESIKVPPIFLSEREIEVLKGICLGLSNIEIGEKLFISNRTVDGHRANLLSKTECKNTASLVMWAIKNGVVAVD